MKLSVRICSLLIAFSLIFTMQGCSVSEMVSEPAGKTEEAGSKTEVKKVDKAVKEESNITEDKRIYSDDDDSSVITMYLNVSRGNYADGSDHSWEEINTYSAYDYERMGVDRYKVEGILNIDETGEGINENSFGYGETVPNVSVQVRGQTSSRSDQKNYKIRIKEGRGEFRGQRTLNLNKHKNDPYRFLNKLSYDLLKPVPQLIGGRTQFVHLYVKDSTGSVSVNAVPEEVSENAVPEEISGNGIGTQGSEGVYENDLTGYADYGIYTMVEQVNRTFLRNHGLDENGQLYKVTFFEWDKYEEMMVPFDDPLYDEEDYSRYIEVKGNPDPSKLQEVLSKVNNYSVPIESIIEDNFDAQNLCYWMAFNIMTGNYDTGARNLFLYSPLNSERFYMICWDMDASFRTSYNTWRERHDGESWEQGMTKFLGLRLIRRMMKEEKYREMLREAVEDIHDNYVNNEKVSKQVDIYRDIIKQYLYRDPDYENSQMRTPDVYDTLTEEIKLEADANYEIFLESMKKPWPFFVGVPTVDTEHNETILSWEASYDYNDSEITYEYLLARDPLFEDVIDEGRGLPVPLAKIDILSPGTYFLRVTAVNEEGYSMECFDYYEIDGYGKSYGCYCFKVGRNGHVSSYK